MGADKIQNYESGKVEFKNSWPLPVGRFGGWLSLVNHGAGESGVGAFALPPHDLAEVCVVAWC